MSEERKARNQALDQLQQTQELTSASEVELLFQAQVHLWKSFQLRLIRHRYAKVWAVQTRAEETAPWLCNLFGLEQANLVSTLLETAFQAGVRQTTAELEGRAQAAEQRTEFLEQQTAAIAALLATMEPPVLTDPVEPEAPLLETAELSMEEPLPDPDEAHRQVLQEMTQL